MPHCVLEITENIFESSRIETIMKECANALNDVGCFKEDDIKIRARSLEYAFLGVQEQEHSYVAAEVSCIDNKTEEQLKSISDNVMAVLQKNFAQLIGKASITVKVSPANPDTYGKWQNF